MSALAAVEQVELRTRLETVLNRLDVLFKEIGPRLQEVGMLREEAGLVYDELKRRGVIIDASEKDVKKSVL